MAVEHRISLEGGPEAELLEFFYPIHYKIGRALEDALRGDLLTRKQLAILWLMRSEGGKAGRMRRKDIQRLIATWFEISSSSITKALRAMASPPLSLVRLVEDPQSGREKLVILTPKGERFLVTMVERGREFLRPMVAQLPAEEIRAGIHFFRRGIAVTEQVLGKSAVNSQPSESTSEKMPASVKRG
jgi:DNA-binding MarR family transcriptional regulator